MYHNIFLLLIWQNPDTPSQQKILSLSHFLTHNWPSATRHLFLYWPNERKESERRIHTNYASSVETTKYSSILTIKPQRVLLLLGLGNGHTTLHWLTCQGMVGHKVGPSSLVYLSIFTFCNLKWNGISAYNNTTNVNLPFFYTPVHYLLAVT